MLALPFGKLLHRMAKEANITCYDISFERKFDPKSIRLLKEVIRSEQIELINPQESRDRYAAIFGKIFYGIKSKIVLTRRQKVADNNFFKRFLHVRYSECIVVISDGLKKHVVAKGFPAGHLHVIYNGIPTEQFKCEPGSAEKLREKYGIMQSDKVVGCVARPKLQNQLIEAVRHMPDVKLLLVGLTLESFTEHFPNTSLEGVRDRIIFTGILHDQQEILTHYQLMHVHVLPSKMDGFGLVSVEAMAMGVPVIGSDFGGIPDVIEHGISGFIFENGRIAMLEQQISVLLQNDSTRIDFIKSGFDRALNKFSINTTISSYERLFQKIIKE